MRLLHLELERGQTVSHATIFRGEVRDPLMGTTRSKVIGGSWDVTLRNRIRKRLLRLIGLGRPENGKTASFRCLEVTTDNIRPCGFFDTAKDGEW